MAGNGEKKMELTFDELRAVNVERCNRWHPGFPKTQCGALTSIAASDKGAIREYIDAGLLVVWCQNCTPQRPDCADCKGTGFAWRSVEPCVACDGSGKAK